MIEYVEKGGKLHTVIGNAGYRLKDNTNDEAFDLIGNQSAAIDSAVQAIINNYDPLPDAKASAITEIAQYASDLIDNSINPIKAKRIQADATLASSKKANGKPLSTAEVGMLDRFETAMFYPQAIFAQYDIEEARIIAATDWQAMDETGAKARLEAT